MSTTTPDGQPWPEEGEDTVMMWDGRDVTTLADAEARANAHPRAGQGGTGMSAADRVLDADAISPCPSRRPK